VGGNQELKVDVRLIAATNRDIVNAIRANQFREDLFHRLNVVQFTPPSLREREGDVLILADHFLKQFTTGMNKPVKEFSPEAEKLLLAHHWPGNVRELRNAIERSVILETQENIQASSLPNFKVESRLGSADSSIPISSASLEEQLSEFEHELILKKLSEYDFNVDATAGALQMTPHSLHYRMHRLKIELEPS
jgi:transcriptional regulator with PAS, ATPase and Fis domain